ncbi:unnamed protein product [Eruca vesicaria subsp. sativa]|uniref:WRKY domain-containing protein n=1 Tax=Eruca vesicaria subsp. sativa TaxID=29727 RepID=A0ABC8L3T8_ERUVS|nr:unnamed protein product [Eruca vesicaria subsp. sativa]
MESNSNNTKSIQRKVVDDLVEGSKFTTQLQLLLSHRHSNHNIETGSLSGDSDLVNELIVKILGCFHKTISVLDPLDLVPDVYVPVAVEGSRNASCVDDSAAPASCNGGDSGDSRKRLGVSKGKRGCYIRKKRSHTWTVEAKRIDEDGHAWRKYGQKEILNTKFPRSYFRCTHKPTQGCKATKQVQKLERDPEMFQITYIGHHTCNVSDQTQVKTETNIDSDNTLAATSFHKDHVNANVQEQENDSSVEVATCMVKQEENNNDDQIKDSCEGSSTDGDLSLVWQDEMMFDDYQHHDQDHHYYHGETSTTSHQFSFIDNDQLFSLFDTYCANAR